MNNKSIQGPIVIACLVAIAVAPTQPTGGACGTTYAFLLHFLSAMLTSALDLRRIFVDGQDAVRLVFFGLNFLFAGVPLLYFLSIRAKFRNHHLPILACVWTATYAAVYFVLLPTQDCP